MPSRLSVTTYAAARSSQILRVARRQCRAMARLFAQTVALRGGPSLRHRRGRQVARGSCGEGCRPTALSRAGCSPTGLGSARLPSTSRPRRICLGMRALVGGALAAFAEVERPRRVAARSRSIRGSGPSRHSPSSQVASAEATSFLNFLGLIPREPRTYRHTDEAQVEPPSPSSHPSGSPTEPWLLLECLLIDQHMADLLLGKGR
jgi:hypothetical protein